MTGFDFANASVPVREDIQAAHRLVWQRLARPGSWWNGEERVAIAAAVRGAADCGLCAERTGALSPLAVQGVHDHEGVLPDVVVEVVHQVVNDPGRLSKVWFEKVQADGLSPGRYVETLGLVVAVVSIDGFCRGLGVPPHPLPRPEAGEPSGYQPESAVQGEAWVPMIPANRARGAESDLWKGARTGNVIRAMSLVPDAVRDLNTLSSAHYLPLDKVPDPRARLTLDRSQIELLAGRVSALSECFY